MTTEPIQSILLDGQRYVILPEAEYCRLTGIDQGGGEGEVAASRHRKYQPRSASSSANTSTQREQVHGELNRVPSPGAAGQQRVLVSFNVGHFAALHAKWLSQDRHHAGIIVSAQRPIGECVRRLLHLADTLKADSMQDRLEYLSDW